MKSKEEILKSLDNYNLEADVNSNFSKIWQKLSDKPNLSPQENPVGILLGGQPGAGKSFATEDVEQRLNGNVIAINVDDFREFHKHFDDFYICCNLAV